MTHINQKPLHDIIFLTIDMLKELEGQLIQIGHVSSTKRWNTHPGFSDMPNHDAAVHAVEEHLALEIEGISAKYVLYGQKFSAEAPDGQSGTVWQSADLFASM
jgi:hypothetical protein